MNPFLEAARVYATQLEWFIFPIAPREKTPLFPTAHPEGDPLRGKCKGECGKLGHGLYDATRDIATLETWWGEHPNANLGLDCGRSNIAVIDIDGAEAIKRWNLIFDSAALHSIRQAVQISGSGAGFHLVYRQPEQVRVKNSTSKIGTKIDTRGDGGYIVLAPSIHPSGNAYAWKEKYTPFDGFDTFPDAILPHLIDYKKEFKPDEQTHRKPNNNRVLQRAYEHVATAPSGSRNTTLYNRSLYVARLYKEIESERQVPPYSLQDAQEVLALAGRMCGLDANEINKTIASAMSVA